MDKDYWNVAQMARDTDLAGIRQRNKDGTLTPVMQTHIDRRFLLDLINDMTEVFYGLIPLIEKVPAKAADQHLIDAIYRILARVEAK